MTQHRSWPDLARTRSEHVWQLNGPDGRSVVATHTPRLVTDDMMALAVPAGVGVAQLPTMTIREEFRAGTLQRVLPDWVPQSGVVQAIFPLRRGLLPAVRQLIDYLATEFGRLAGEDQPPR